VDPSHGDQRGELDIKMVMATALRPAIIHFESAPGGRRRLTSPRGRRLHAALAAVLEREPEGRIVWLEPDEEARLLEACRASRTKHLASLVTVALESGLQRAELLGLTWDRVDFSRGVLRLEKTKSGKRREVPMRQAVYEVLVGPSRPA
jgi:integrase